MAALQPLQMAVDVKKQTVHSGLHKLVIKPPQWLRKPNLRYWLGALHFFATRIFSVDADRLISTTSFSKQANQSTRSNSNGNFQPSIPRGIGTLLETVTRLNRSSNNCAAGGRF